jgi:hypothetical protein
MSNKSVDTLTINFVGTSNITEATFVSWYVFPIKDMGAENVRGNSVAAVFVFQSIKTNYTPFNTILRLESTVSYFMVALSAVRALADVPLQEGTINIDNGNTREEFQQENYCSCVSFVTCR